MSSAILMPCAHVVARAAHFREVPARAEIARAHLGVRFEAAAREHDRLRADLDVAALVLRLDADDLAVVVGEQRQRGRFVEDLDAFALARLVLVVDEARRRRPTSPRRGRPRTCTCRLRPCTTGGRSSAGSARLSCAATPASRSCCVIRISVRSGSDMYCVMRPMSSKYSSARVAAVVVRLLLVLGEVGNELRDVVDVVVDDAHEAAGVAAVAAGVLDRARLRA